VSHYRLTPEASRDLEEIADFLAEDDAFAAARLVDAIEEKCRALAAMPGMGRARDEFAPGLRSSLSGRYLVFFRPVDDGIQVIRIVHGSRDLPKLFE